MKASLNGVLNLSILDGWWLEGFCGDNGWAFGGETAPGDRSPADASAIYQIIEGKIIPLYYDTYEDGIPIGWVKVMKNAIKQTGSYFSARRMVKEYVRKFYTKALSKA
jgi:starch phosphorylase